MTDLPCAFLTSLPSISLPSQTNFFPCTHEQEKLVYLDRGHQNKPLATNNSLMSPPHSLPSSLILSAILLLLPYFLPSLKLLLQPSLHITIYQWSPAEWTIANTSSPITMSPRSIDHPALGIKSLPSQSIVLWYRHRTATPISLAEMHYM